MRPPRRLPQLPPFSSNRAFYYSVFAHVALILVFVVGVDWKRSSTVTPVAAPPVMNARAVDADQVAAEARKIEQAEKQKQEAIQRKEEEARRKVQEEERKLEQLREEKRTEVRKLAEQKKAAETERKQAERKAKAAAEKKARAEAEAKKAKAEAQQKAKAEAERKAKAAAEKKARAEAEAKKALAEALAAEEAEAAAAAQAAADATELQRWLGRIQAAVAAGFVYPPGLPPGLQCKLLVRVVPGGDVVSATVVESSGNAVFDRQAETAVRKAAPLPVPADARLFNQMREFYFTFAPNG